MRWSKYPADWPGPATQRHASVSVRPLTPTSRRVGQQPRRYDDRDPVKAAVPAALDGRSRSCRIAGCPTPGFANRGVQWAELGSAQTSRSWRRCWMSGDSNPRSAARPETVGGLADPPSIDFRGDAVEVEEQRRPEVPRPVPARGCVVAGPALDASAPNGRRGRNLSSLPQPCCNPVKNDRDTVLKEGA
jgi:hypothetical protein